MNPPARINGKNNPEYLSWWRTNNPNYNKEWDRKYKKHRRGWRLKNKAMDNAIGKRSKAKGRRELTDSYIRGQIGLGSKTPAVMIEAKRIQLQIKRLVKLNKQKQKTKL